MISFKEFMKECVVFVRGDLGLETNSSNGELLGTYYYQVNEDESSISIQYWQDSGKYHVNAGLGIGVGHTLTEAYNNALKVA